MKKSNICFAEVLISGILWGIIGVFNRYYAGIGITSVNLVILRLSLGTALIFAYLLIRSPKALKFRWKDAWIFVGAGILSIVVFQTCYMMTIQASSLSLAAVLLYTSPVFVTIMASLFFKEPFTLRKVGGSVLTVIGCALAAGLTGGMGITLPVLVTGLLSGIGYAVYSIFAKAALNRGYASITITAWSFFFAMIPLLFLADFGLIAERISLGGGKAIIMWILLALLTEALPYLLYTDGLVGMEAGKAAVTVAIEPIVATFVGILFYHETMTLLQGVGTVLVIGAILILNLPAKPKNKN